MRKLPLRLSQVSLVGAAVAASALLFSGPASALPSTCPSGSNSMICFYYDGNATGAVWRDPGVSRPDLAGFVFSGGNGSGTRVKNNAASVANPTQFNAYIFYNERCSGPYDAVAAYATKNLVNTWNNEASWEQPFGNDGTVGRC